METIALKESDVVAQDSIEINLQPTEIQQIFSLLQQAERSDILEKLITQLKEKQIDYQILTKPMAYRDFINLEQVQEFLGLTIEEYIFYPTPPILEPSERLKNELEEAEEYSPVSEKERSEWIIKPILAELRRINQNQFHIYSGRYLNVDEERGLRGECDFMLAFTEAKKVVNPPVFCLVEAKKEDIMTGISQCVAQMVGAKEFNQKKGKDLAVIYGCVTTGNEWQFLKLENNTLHIDDFTYFINEAEKILGILQSIVDFYKPKV